MILEAEEEYNFERVVAETRSKCQVICVLYCF
jgi:hypothetical protein